MADVTFRLDCSTEVGAGHLHRSLCLANELLNLGLECEFFVRPNSLPFASLVESCGHTLHLMRPGNLQLNTAKTLSEHTTWLGMSPEEDANELCQSSQSQILIADHYGISQNWLDIVRGRFKRVCLFDDLNNLNYDKVDLILSPNPSSSKFWDKLGLATCKILTGPDAIFIKPSWLKASEVYSISREVNRIAIVPGGTDPSCLIEKILPKLLSEFRNHEFVVLFKPNPVRQRNLIKNFQGDRVTFIFDSNDLSEQLSMCDLAIGTAGSGAWERAALGIPQVNVRAIADQYSIAKFLLESGISQTVDVEENHFIDRLVDSVNLLIRNFDERKRMSETGRKLLKTNSAKIVAKIIMEYCLEVE